jgi:hypothetical protein
MEVLGGMSTAYHLDNGTLMLTHYCGAGNQPRMRVKASRTTAAASHLEMRTMLDVRAKRSPTGRFTKQQVLEQARAWGLTNRRNRPLTSQAIGMLLRNRLYAGIVDVPAYGVRAKRGDFEPLISEELFYRVQSVLSGRVPSTTPQQRAHPDFPLRAFVRCESCGRGLTSNWSKGRRASRLEVPLGRRHGPNRILGNARSGRLSAHPKTQ